MSMTKRTVTGSLMPSDKLSTAPAPSAVEGPAQPQTRSELQAWVRDRLALAPTLEQSLLTAIDAVFARQERLWQESKQDAITALATGFAEKMSDVASELSARDATVNSISRYFEALVADLTDKSHRDPKTKLMNFGRFTEQLESFLALEQRGRWCAVGLVDITGFKWYNDALGHAVGDRIIERVAMLLREQVRSDDLLAQESVGPRSKDLHARFGGDEFCFLIPDLASCQLAHAIGERFREAVERFDWALEEDRLAVQPVRVDVGVVCLWLGRVSDRRFIAKRLSGDLIQCADKLMYEAKTERANHIHLLRAKLVDGHIVDSRDADPETVEEEEA
ncbi:MAG TPA: GGDEF domain-containing protein [Vicinamibacterales bacterium]|jgi:diguanylate cyclase (GGDEF)-like protein|nr:GGDEF domain-containing protein [Vicinamibacterales bacterium]